MAKPACGGGTIDVDPKTVANGRRRTGVEDQSMGLKAPAVHGALPRRGNADRRVHRPTALPLDDCL
jgi:hypothetical protein